MLSQIQAEYGARGLQVIGLGIQPLAPDAINIFRSRTGANFPLGTVSDEAVRGFLEHPVMYRFLVPQMAFLDRSGNIRVQRGGAQDEGFLRNEEAIVRQAVEMLLAEKPPAAKRGAPAPKKK